MRSSGNQKDDVGADVRAAASLPAKRLTVTFEDVAVEVHGLGEDYVATVGSAFTDLFPKRQKGHSKRYILQGISGQVRPGEMLLVLGRPGSGCTSLLKVLANMRDEFPTVEGAVRYGSIGPKEAQQFRQYIVMNTEEDLHFPDLTVAQTMAFASATKLPGNRDEPSSSARTYNATTPGARKSATSLSEAYRAENGRGCLWQRSWPTQAPLQCWDNSTRGLDASNALDFAKLLRKTADEQQKTIISTLYQAGNGIYDQFDKVLVLAEGRQIYYGPRETAQAYFESLGFVCAPGANVGDFLTSCAVHTERKVAPGYENLVPNTASEFEARYKESVIYRQIFEQSMSSKAEDALAQEIEDLKDSWQILKNRSVGFMSRKKSPYHVSFGRQVVACAIRQFEIIWGDRWTNTLNLSSSIIMAIVTGSLFYHLPDNSQSIFPRPGALFYPILLFGLNALSEVQASFLGRPIVSRHKRLAFARPAAFAFASAITDIPLVIALFSLFHLAYYFMCWFQVDAGKFFTQWIILVVTVLCMMSFFRAVGAWCKNFGFASQLSGWLIMATMLYGGYLLPFPHMHPWFRWIAYINPAAYSFMALLGTEMGNRELDCVEPQYVPYGGSYDGSVHRGCTIPGSSIGTSVINGNDYIKEAYLTSQSVVWRNFGIVVAFWVFFAVMAAVGFEVQTSSGTGSRILFDRTGRKQQLADLEDSEKAISKMEARTEGGVSAGQTTFTFKDISYYVHHEGKELQLLRSVSGYVEPGQLVALMGSSGAGKTTLMDVLAQRKDSGRIEGSIMVNGKPQGISFQRTTGYCEQSDVHEPTCTVLESLCFSARLRQDYKVPDEDKIQYVHQIMELLELTPLQHAIVGSPGSGLSIEQRKRLTLATELVAKPSLLFLDEPTSGLDGQSAFEICRFMRKLAASGQTIICTIHQPSATLFEAFDVLLLLARGGRTTYFGPTGEGSSILLDYFARHGAPCPANTNPAEHIVDVVQGRLGDDVDWPEQWLTSPEYQHMHTQIDTLNSTSAVEKEIDTESGESSADFATPVRYQVLLVTKRQLLGLWRNPDYIWNKLGIHISNSLFAGFTFWMVGNSEFDLQMRLMSVFNFVFVAVGCINQLQPFFIRNRDIFETREKKSKTYHWFAFISAQLLSEIPALIVCGTLYFCCWYFTSGFPVKASISGQVYLQMILYEFLYTSIGQAIAAYSPNAYFAALANPLIIGSGLINFCGVVVPYEQIVVFWRYWIYWLDPFTYLVGGLLEPVLWDVQVHCKDSELTRIPLPANTTCGEYMADFLSTSAGYVTDPGNSNFCAYCPYSSGAEYLKTMNIGHSWIGWRDVGITALFCISSYALVFLTMKLRSKATKSAG